jgi:hypothetical protein
LRVVPEIIGPAIGYLYFLHIDHLPICVKETSGAIMPTVGVFDIGVEYFAVVQEKVIGTPAVKLITDHAHRSIFE